MLTAVFYLVTDDYDSFVTFGEGLQGDGVGDGEKHCLCLRPQLLHSLELSSVVGTRGRLPRECMEYHR